MFLKILKKDLVRKKTMNIILLLFVLLSSMFMGSSMNNFAVSTSAVEHFFAVSNTADVIAVVAGSEDELVQVDQYLSEFTDITEFSRDVSIMGAESYLYYENGEIIKLASSDMGVYLMKKPETHSLIFTVDNEPVTVKDGEIAVPNVIAEGINVKVGDKLTMKYQDFEKKYVVSAITKDAGFGTSLGGTGRIVMSDHDFEELTEMFPVKVAFYHIMTQDSTDLRKTLGETVNGLKTSVDKSMFQMCYLFDVMMAAIMLIVSVCLLLVAFLILRFTIIFTLEDDYKEIGVLKAVGIRNRSIRELYLSKYLALSLLGASLGCIGSFPFGNLLNSSLNKNIVAKETGGYAWINVLCALFVVILVGLFCYGCTRKLNQFSAIEAIRCGSKGESYSVKSKIRFSRLRKLSAVFAMALNDVFSNCKRYIVMTVTFFICLLLMILPMVVVNTLQNPSVTLKLLGVENGGIYVYIPTREIMLKANREYTEDYIHTMEEELSALGYDAKVSLQAFLSTKLKYPNKEGEYVINSVMDLNTEVSSIQPVEGSCPMLANEFAMSILAMQEFGGKIGETYTVTIGEKSYEMILTGTYSNMNNLGKTAHITQLLDVDFSQLSAIMPATVQFNQTMSEEEFKKAYETIKSFYSDYAVYTEEEYAENFMGSYITMFRDAGKIVITIALIVIFLVSLLMSKSFVTRETDETALLKSIGFTSGSIRRRYITRIEICLTVSLVLLYLTSIPISNLIISKVFTLFGAYGVKAIISPVFVAIIYPVMVLADILVAGYFGTTAISRIDPKEVNNAE